MRTILFLCSGNYYRSRFAEHYFNDRARRIGLDWLAISRGLAKECGVTSIDPISPLALVAMAHQDVTIPGVLRAPRAVGDDDLLAADMVIAVKEAELRPLMQKRFPSWEEHISYWYIDDLDASPPGEALLQLAAQIDKLLSDLVASNRSASIQPAAYTEAVAAPAIGWQLPHVEAGASYYLCQSQVLVAGG
jgi:protein-tyrosine-phosphatase